MEKRRKKITFDFFASVQSNFKWSQTKATVRFMCELCHPPAISHDIYFSPLALNKRQRETATRKENGKNAQFATIIWRLNRAASSTE